MVAKENLSRVSDFKVWNYVDIRGVIQSPPPVYSHEVLHELGLSMSI